MPIDKFGRGVEPRNRFSEFSIFKIIEKVLARDDYIKLDENGHSFNLKDRRICGLGAPVSGTDAVNKDYLDKNLVRYVDKTSEGNIDMKQKRIENLSEPINDFDAVNKSYINDCLSRNLSVITLTLEDDKSSEFFTVKPYDKNYYEFVFDCKVRFLQASSDIESGDIPVLWEFPRKAGKSPKRNQLSRNEVKEFWKVKKGHRFYFCRSEKIHSSQWVELIIRFLET